MNVAKLGKHKILMFRLLEDAADDSAAKLALQTNHSWSYTRSTESTATKDGAIVSQGGLEATLNIEAVASDDPVNNMLKEAVIESKKLEVWEIDIGAEQVEGKYPATYAQGNLENWEVPNEVEGLVTLSTTMRIDGAPKDGMATITAEQAEEISYAFRDVTPVPAP